MTGTVPTLSEKPKTASEPTEPAKKKEGEQADTKTARAPDVVAAVAELAGTLPSHSLVPADKSGGKTTDDKGGLWEQQEF